MKLDEDMHECLLDKSAEGRGTSRRTWSARCAPRRGLALSLAVTLLTAATVNVVPILLGRLITALHSCEERGALASEWPGLAVFFLGLILIAFLAREGLQMLRRYLARRACARVEEYLTVRLLDRLLRAELRFFSTQKIGALQARVRHGIEAHVTLLRLGLQDLAPALFTAGCAIVYALYCQPLVGVLLLVAVPAPVLIAAWQTRVQKGAGLKIQQIEETLGGALVEQLGGVEYLRVADTHDHEVGRVGRLAEERCQRQVQQQLRSSLFESVKAMNDWLFQTGVLTCTLYLVMNGQAEIGAVLTLWYLCFNILTPLRDIHRIFDEVHESRLRVGDLQTLLREPLDRSFVTGQTLGTPAHESEPLFSTKDVVVEYVTASGEKKRALDGVSMRIHAGEVVALAGRSGGGKSTLLRLLLRLTHPSSGEARLLGAPLTGVGRRALARLVGYVGQEPFVMAGTVAQNIAYGAASPPTPATVRQAAKQAGLHRDVLRMPGGYAAAVGERGAALSGGQRQRLALARALLGAAPLLVLDEATSALDAAAERQVLRAARAVARRGGAVLLAAHRPRLLRLADRVLVLEHGRLVEEGTYDQLLKRDGPFAQMIRDHAQRRRTRRERPDVAATV